MATDDMRTAPSDFRTERIYTPQTERVQGETKSECYERDRRFGDCLLPEIAIIAGQLGLSIDDNEDRRQNTDLSIFDTKWSIRIRGREAYDNPNFRNDVSIRLMTGNGNKSEYDKIKNGYCNFMFYGFMDKTREEYNAWKNGQTDDRPHLIYWTILNMKAFQKFALDLVANGTEKNWLLDRAVQHRPPDRSTCIYVKRDEIPHWIIATADDWKRETLTTWIRPYDKPPTVWFDSRVCWIGW